MDAQTALEARIRTLVGQMAPPEEIEPLVRIVATVLHEMFTDPEMLKEIKLVRDLTARNAVLESAVKRLTAARGRTRKQTTSTAGKTVREVLAERSKEANAQRAQNAQAIRDAFLTGFEERG